MTSLPFLVATLLAAQADAGAASDAARAAAAAEKAAQAAQTAAEAALKAAEAAARLSAVVPAKFEVPAAPPAAAPAAAPKAAWNGTVGLGLISLSGNARSITFTTNAAAERKSEDWIFSGKLLASYGEARVTVRDTTTGTDQEQLQTVAEQASLLLRGDRRFGQRYSGYLLGEAATDHVKSVELRSSGEAGASIVWVDAKGESGWATTLRTDLGFRISEERRYTYFPEPRPTDPPAVMLYAPRAGLALTYAMSKDVLFSEQAEIMSNVYGDSRVLVNSVSKISMRLSRSLAFGVAFTVLHDSAPAATKVATDTQLALTLDVLL